MMIRIQENRLRISEYEVDSSLKLEAIVQLLFAILNPRFIQDSKTHEANNHILGDETDYTHFTQHTQPLLALAAAAESHQLATNQIMPQNQLPVSEAQVSAGSQPDKRESIDAQLPAIYQQALLQHLSPALTAKNLLYANADTIPLPVTHYHQAIGEAIKAEYGEREDRKDVIPIGVLVRPGEYELSLEKRMGSVSERLVSGFYRGEKILLKAAENSELALLDKLLEEKGLVPLYERTDDGAVQLKEILGLDNANYNILVKDKRTGEELSQGSRLGTATIADYQNKEFSIRFGAGQQNPDTAYLNTSLLKPFITQDGRRLEHAYKVFEPHTVSTERAADDSVRLLEAVNENGQLDSFQVRNNSAFAFLYDSLVWEGYTPLLKKMSFLKNGIQMNGAYIENLEKNGQKIVKDKYHSGLLGLQMLQNGECQEALAGFCSLPLHETTLKNGESWLVSAVKQGGYDHRSTAPISERYIN